MWRAPRLLCFSNFFSAQPFPVPSSPLPESHRAGAQRGGLHLQPAPARWASLLSLLRCSRVGKKVFTTLNLQERGFQNPYGGLTWTCGRGTWLGLYSTGTGGDGVFLLAAGRAAGPVLTTVSPLQVWPTRPYGQPAFRTWAPPCPRSCGPRPRGSCKASTWAWAGAAGPWSEGFWSIISVSENRAEQFGFGYWSSGFTGLAAPSWFMHKVLLRCRDEGTG